jgi:hypothetical protein
MSETVRNKATVLEVPVTIQGSKTVEGAEQREVFSETTKTTLVFDNGAVVKLNARVLPGQCVFLRNDQSGREILCKVLDPKTGQAGYTDLEFSSYDPNFWDVSAEKPAAGGPKLTAQDRLEAGANSPVAAPAFRSSAPAGEEFSVRAEEPGSDGQKSAAQKKIDEAVRNLVTAPSAESSGPRGETPASFLESPKPPKTGSTLVASTLPEILMPAHEAPTLALKSESSTHETVPASVPESVTPAKAAGTLLASASPATLLPAGDSPIGALKSEPTDDELDWNEAKDAEMLAALATMEAGSKSNREPAAKNTPEPKARVRETASADAQKKGGSDAHAANANSAIKAKVFSTPASHIGKLRALAAGKNPIVIGIVAFVLLAALLGFAWRMKSGFSSRSSNRPASASAQAKHPAPPATPASSQAPASTVAARADNGVATPAQAAPNTHQPYASATEKREAADAQNGPTATAAIRAVPVTKRLKDSTASAAPKAAATEILNSADRQVLGLATPRKTNEQDSRGNFPPEIVSQTPPSIPSWAKDLDVAQVVKLDALIDEKGNLVETKPISGPRVLQSAAERAVELWVFEPALSDGKPVAARMVLTVQFTK